MDFSHELRVDLTSKISQCNIIEERIKPHDHSINADKAFDKIPSFS
jgi:hypothetical protein